MKKELKQMEDHFEELVFESLKIKEKIKEVQSISRHIEDQRQSAIQIDRNFLQEMY